VKIKEEEKDVHECRVLDELAEAASPPPTPQKKKVGLQAYKKLKEMKEKGVYECETCNKTFSDSKSLKRHIKTIHHHSGPFKCDICDRRFETAKSLKRHKSKDHKPDP